MVAVEICKNKLYYIAVSFWTEKNAEGEWGVCIDNNITQGYTFYHMANRGTAERLKYALAFEEQRRIEDIVSCMVRHFESKEERSHVHN